MLEMMNVFSLILSILSMTLSIGNTLYVYIWQSRVHLSLNVEVRRVYNAAGVETEGRILYWSIVNMSAFAVYVMEIGFCGSSQETLHKVPNAFVHISGCGKRAEIPYKLLSREGVRFQVEQASQTEELKNNARMYVKTSCGYFVAAEILMSTFTLI